MVFKRLLWTSMLSKSKNGIVLARLYQALCYYTSSIFENDYAFDSLSSTWLDLADDVYDKLTLIDKGIIEDVSDEYLSKIRMELNIDNSVNEDSILDQLRKHIMNLIRGEDYNEMPVYIGD